MTEQHQVTVRIIEERDSFLKCGIDDTKFSRSSRRTPTDQGSESSDSCSEQVCAVNALSRSASWANESEEQEQCFDERSEIERLRRQVDVYKRALESTTREMELVLARSCAQEEEDLEASRADSRVGILVENKRRYTLYPIEKPDIYDYFKKQQASLWTTEEIDLAQDQQDVQRLTAEEMHFLEHVLAFFAASDGIVIENLASNLMTSVQCAEARAFYAVQGYVENVHSETYSILIDTLVRDVDKKNDLFNAVERLPCVVKKADWSIKWVNANCSFAQRLVAFAIVEGLFFSAAFAAIFWLRKRGLMPGLCFANELISRDEGLHADFACHLFREEVPEDGKPTREWVEGMMREAVEVEREFVYDSLPVRLIGMNDDLMFQYVRFCADRLMVSLGYEKLFEDACPFDFMELISLQGKANFFEKRVSEYALSGVMASATSPNKGHCQRREFSIDEDF